MKKFVLFLGSLVLAIPAFGDDQLGREGSVISTGVPFLTITPDSRSGGMADVGAATSPDVYSNHWNPAKIAFGEQSGIGLSYTPWLSNIANDIHLSYLSGYYKIDELSGFGASMRYFSLGDITFTTELGQFIGDHRPYEMAFDGSYSRKLSDRFSVGVGLRYIYSNLTGGGTYNGVESTPGRSIAGDVAAYYTRDRDLFGYDGNLSFGLNLSNLGAKIAYTETIDPSFLPANMRLGATGMVDVDDFNQLGVSIDVNKLLVPTNPTYEDDGETIRSGMDPDVPVMQGVIQSFYDAPGGFNETMKEFMPSVGIEYWYNQQFALRSGYFYEHISKGNRQFMSFGLGLRLNVLGIDVAYLFNTSRRIGSGEDPLHNTLRFSLSVLFDETGFVNRENE